MKNQIVRQFSATIAATVIVFTSGVRTAFGQQTRASSRSMYEAGLNMRARLKSEGYDLISLKDVPYYHRFMRGYTTQTVYVDIPKTGRYILLVGGDNDTQDLDIKLHGIGSDLSRANTGFIVFNVYKPGRLYYDIKMLGCKAPNCGIFAVLLSTK
ncbi:hypothetical protein [Moorena sp. SIO3I6]|uniref:hypothetical protein n=1 Tax=Moorena sp. SIO3I6 TaxID=2607831 RepID=UPI0013F9C5EB|nr:hypothetical protein [Moorena sp. SIO3I6]NEP23860.1 hypothetical protein [Moorena sp. SIO3I6]